MTALDRIRRAARQYPDRTACVAGEGSLTYAQLTALAERYADCLRRQGTGPVILFGPKSVRTVAAIMACLSAGRAYVPVGAFTPPARLRKIAALTKAALIVSDIPADVPGAVCCRLTELERFAGEAEKPNDNGIAYIIFTSGSTGDPKGVPISYANLDRFAAWIAGLSPLRDYRAVSVLNQADFSFDLSVADCFYALCNGHTLVCGAPADDLDGVFQTLKTVDVAVVTPTFLRLCLLEKTFRAENYPRLRCVYCCGEPLDPALAQRLFAAFPEAALLNAYGPTEATSAVSAAIITPETARTMPLLPVGEADTCAVEIVVDDGEIVLKGDSVFGGYLNGGPGGWYRENGVNCYRTGDLGEWRDGLLFCRGRADGQIKYKGYRIELNGIEACLSRVDGVTACAVAAARNAGGAVTLLKAFYTGSADEATVRTQLQKDLPDHMVPHLIRRLDRLPVNENGKVDRKALT